MFIDSVDALQYLSSETACTRTTDPVGTRTYAKPSMSSDTERKAGDTPAGLTSSPSHLGVGENVNAEDIPARADED